MNNLTIPAYSEQAAQAVKERLDSLAKVPGSLGKLEELAIRLAGITGRTCPSFPQKSVVLFAADHDITLKGVSATGQEVTEIRSATSSRAEVRSTPSAAMLGLA